MLNWLANALATRITRIDREATDAALKEIRSERDEGRREVRALVGEMEDMLEKFSRVVARQAMRRSRAMKAALDEQEEPAPLLPGAAAAAAAESERPLSRAERKAAIRARMAQGGGLVGIRQRAGGEE